MPAIPAEIGCCSCTVLVQICWPLSLAALCAAVAQAFAASRWTCSIFHTALSPPAYSLQASLSDTGHALQADEAAEEQAASAGVSAALSVLSQGGALPGKSHGDTNACAISRLPRAKPSDTLPCALTARSAAPRRIRWEAASAGISAALSVLSQVGALPGKSFLTLMFAIHGLHPHAVPQRYSPVPSQLVLRRPVGPAGLATSTEQLVVVPLRHFQVHLQQWRCREAQRLDAPICLQQLQHDLPCRHARVSLTRQVGCCSTACWQLSVFWMLVLSLTRCSRQDCSGGRCGRCYWAGSRCWRARRAEQQTSSCCRTRAAMQALSADHACGLQPPTLQRRLLWTLPVGRK